MVLVVALFHGKQLPEHIFTSLIHLSLQTHSSLICLQNMYQLITKSPRFPCGRGGGSGRPVVTNLPSTKLQWLAYRSCIASRRNLGTSFSGYWRGPYTCSMGQVECRDTCNSANCSSRPRPQSALSISCNVVYPNTGYNLSTNTISGLQLHATPYRPAVTSCWEQCECQMPVVTYVVSTTDNDGQFV